MIVRPLETRDYSSCLEAMRTFTANRNADTPDEIWLVEHPAVFTQGLAGLAEHVLAAGDIPVLRTERGGQVTYHGPGQILAYLLLDIRRSGWMVRALVTAMEAAVIDTLADIGLSAMRNPGAPGVYMVEGGGHPGAKISALGIKVSRGCTYHGLALNVAMDLEPFARINPCGYAGLAVTDIRTELTKKNLQEASREAAMLRTTSQQLASQLTRHLTRAA